MEDYKKKYEDALERAKEELGSGCFNKGSIEYIFPELVESEDEKSKKWILEYLYDGLRKSDEQFKDQFKAAIAWLEKQGEKPITIGKRQLTGKAAELAKEVTPESLEETKKKMLKETEPKFKVGDWITNSIETVQITGYDIDYGYQVDCKGNLQHRDTDIIEKEYHLWTIQDAKDGDVLQLGKVTAIFKKYIGNGNCKCYCSVYDGEFKIPNTDNSYGCHNAVPATKEQRDILFQKMHKAGYEWDDEKKETKLLISNGGDFEPELSHKEVTKKSDQDNKWSEEDEGMFEEYKLGIRALMKDAYVEKFCNWILTLKQKLLQ